MKAFCAVLFFALTALCLSSPASASFGAAGFDGIATAKDNSLFNQAGGDPYALANEVTFNTVNRVLGGFEYLFPDEPAKDVFADLPAGLLGNTTALPTCDVGLLAFDNEGAALGPLCPSASQLGVAKVTLTLGHRQTVALYNITPPPGAIARFGFNILGTVVLADAELRSGSDYGATVKFRNISQGTAILASKLTFWGDPTDESHDAERSCPGLTPATTEIEDPPSAPNDCEGDYTRPDPTAFLRLPTSCPADPNEGSLWTLALDSWQHPGDFVSASFRTHEAPGLPLPPDEWGPEKGTSGCEAVPFEPTLTATPTTDAADSPTGLEVDLELPQSSDPAAIASSDLKKAVVTLPAGMTVNPAQANGIGSCSSTQIGLLGAEFPAPAPIHFTPDPVQCPDNAKIGAVSIHTPLLDHPLNGAVYLAAQNDNPFKSLLAIYVAVADPQTGIVVKLAGHISIGPDGRLTTTFDNQPQTPFDHFHLSFFGGPTAPLITPPACGKYTTEAKLTPWARPGEEVDAPSSFQITKGPNGEPCPAKPLPFDTSFEAGTVNPLAGTFSPFALSLTREDGTQRFSGLAVTPPPGLLASLKGIPYCPDSALAGISEAEGTAAAQIASPSCPAASQVGTVSAGAGAGPSPFYDSSGKAYLAGPYHGAPLSLAIVTPALAGPFDLGNVVVRTALQVNPDSAQITAVSDPIPTALHGIPLDLRDLRVNLDRPNFTLNPTNCNEMSVGGTATGSEGATAALSNRFQVGNCAALPFRPKLRLRLKGPTNRTAHPSLHATLTAKPGEANIARAQVKLPKAAFLDNAHIGGVCTRVQFAAHACPANSVYGYARAVTPLLDAPLQGPVYLRSSSHKLPDLVADLGGQIEVALAGKTDSVKGALRNTFEAVPDAPVTKFSLTLYGGKRGLIELSSGFCKSPKASVRFDAQNGKVFDRTPVVKADCAKHHSHGGGK